MWGSRQNDPNHRETREVTAFNREANTPDAIFDARTRFGMRVLPPTNLQAEMALLGAMLANNRAYDRVSDFLRPAHFADPINGRIFELIERRITAGQLADAVTLKADLEHSGVLDEVGGTRYLAQLITAMVGIINAGEYGREVYNTWVRRGLIEAGEAIVNQAYGSDASPIEMIADAMAALEAVDRDDSQRSTTTLDQAIDAALEASAAAATQEGPIGLSTGFRRLDERLGGLEDALLYVLGGRPGMGKSALGFQMAVKAAEQGVGVLMSSLEMASPQVGRRVLAGHARVPVTAIKRGTLTTAQAERLVEARNKLRNLPITIDDRAGVTMQKIEIAAAKAHRKHGLGLIAIDHLHIIDPGENGDRNPTYAVGKISGAAKRLAKRFNCPVLLLAQLSRGVEGREDKRPTLADLRQAGAIEQDADVVMFVYRPEYYLTEPEIRSGEARDKFQQRVDEYETRKREVAGVAEVFCAKVRDGEPGIEKLIFHGETTSFTEPFNG